MLLICRKKIVNRLRQGGNCNMSSRSDTHQEFTSKNVLMQMSGVS
jgi:hypothetical protein